jgi:uncharacterized protein (TIGR03083 family)
MPEREANAYRELRVRTSDLIREADPGALDAIAPATPEWRVRDLLAHLVGVTADAANGRLDGVATDPWTAAQVDARRDASIADMLSEWDDYGAQFEGALTALPSTVGGQAVFDAVTHEADMRHALGQPGERTCDGVAISFEFCCLGRTAGGLPALRVVTERGETIAGTGDPIATLETSQFEFIRASSGRRSATEIAEYDWQGQVDPEILLVAPFFRMRSTPLDE